MSKTDGINIVWERLSLNYRKEQRRGIEIWKQVTRFYRQRAAKFHKLIKWRRVAELRRGMLVWWLHG